MVGPILPRVEWLLLPVAGIVVGIVGTFVRNGLRPRLAAARLRRGRAVMVPATLVFDGRRRPARLARVGDDVHVVSAHDHVVVAASELASAATRGSVDTETGIVSVAADLVLPTGSLLTLLTEESWGQVLRDVTAPSTTGLRVSERRLRWLGARRWPLWLAALSVAAAGIVSTLMVLGTERTTPVVRLVDDGYGCLVTWQENGQTFSGAPTCPDPVPAVGETLTYVTTPWPVRGNAWDLDLPWVLVSLLVLVAVVALSWHAWTWTRARRTPPQRVALSSGTSVAPVHPHPAVDVPDDAPHLPHGGSAAQAGRAATTFDEAVDEAAARLGWGDVPPQEPPSTASPLLADVRRAWSATPRALTVLLGLGALSSYDRQWPSAVRAGLASLAVASTLWSLWVVASVYAALRRTWSEPFTSQWRTRLVHDSTGVWHLVLMLGSTPRWVVALPARPADTGTCLVRGDLTEGGSVHVLIGEQVWLPDSAVTRVDDAVTTELLDDLRWQSEGHRAELSSGS